jgi:hypothetical protein
MQTNCLRFNEKLLAGRGFRARNLQYLANVEQKQFPAWITFQQVDDYVPPIWPANAG